MAKIQSKEWLKRKVEEYFGSCYEIYNDEEGNLKQRNIKPLTIAGLALYIGVRTEYLKELRKKEPYKDILDMANQRIEVYAEEALFTNKLTQGMIFNLKARHGWKTEETIELNQNIKIKFGGDDEVADSEESILDTDE